MAQSLEVAFEVIGRMMALVVLIGVAAWWIGSVSFRVEYPVPAKPLAESRVSERGRLKSGRMSGFRRRTEPPVSRRSSRPFARRG